MHSVVSRDPWQASVLCARGSLSWRLHCELRVVCPDGDNSKASADIGTVGMASQCWRTNTNFTNLSEARLQMLQYHRKGKVNVRTTASHVCVCVCVCVFVCARACGFLRSSRHHCVASP